MLEKELVWIQSYYLSRPVHEVPEMFVKCSKSMSKIPCSQRKTYIRPFLGCFSTIFGQNLDLVDSWSARIAKSLSRIERMILLYPCLRLCGSNNHLERVVTNVHMLRKIREEYPAGIQKLEIKDPFDLDILWGVFFATGDPHPVNRIWWESIHAMKKEDLAMFRVAHYGLMNNAKIHSQVEKWVSTWEKELVEMFRELNPKKQKEMREKILSGQQPIEVSDTIASSSTAATTTGDQASSAEETAER